MKLGCVPHSLLMRRNGIFRRAGVTFLGYNVGSFVCFTSNEFYLLPTSFLRHLPFLNSTGKFIDTLSRCGIPTLIFLAGYYNQRALPPLPDYVNLCYIAGIFIYSFQLLRHTLGPNYIKFSISKPLSVTGILLALVFVFTYKTRKYNTSFL